MKKAIYTASFLALFAFTAQAQQQEPKKESQPTQAKPAQAKKDEKAPAAVEQPKTGTRMAINEKGLPASKGNATAKEKKEEKAASPGQPAAAEKH